MFISELLRERRVTVSIELFPPRQDARLEGARAVVTEAAGLAPDFISVTCGASGGTSGNTLEMTRFVKQCGAVALAHLTCVSSSRQEIRGLLESYRDAGIENILALRGDLPADADFPLPGQYSYASELVKETRAFGGFCIGGACYPEGHISAASFEADIRHLKGKVEAGCSFLTTQMFFDNNILYRFLYRIRDIGVDTPVLAGIMPVTNRSQIGRIIKLSGTSLPPRFVNILDKFGGQPEAMRQAGIAYATEQIIDLIANGVRGIHIYTMNKPALAAEILNNISHIIKAG
ncbi:MAG: methylenetetrahydrofolate reductase [Clostridiales bacterium]|jgi:methylenetetrahydrofolate reductase (NADPH)|nr:methylenetetrahydrofolate reductase [Clostridiales bacterium]